MPLTKTRNQLLYEQKQFCITQLHKHSVVMQFCYTNCFCSLPFKVVKGKLGVCAYHRHKSC